jgi:recombination protein RecA
MGEEHRQRVIRQKVVRLEASAPPLLATGFSSLDRASGGLPRGRITEIFGAPGSGKTTFALHTVAHVQRDGGPAAWIDAEHTFDPGYASRLGVAVEQMPVAQPDSAEQALEIVRQLVASGAVDLVVVDSAAALVPEIELQTGLGQSGPGTQSRVLASGLRKLDRVLRRSVAAVLFLNQTRVYEESEIPAGGPPLKLFAALRISLHATAGGRTRFRVLKNKGAEAFGEGELAWDNGTTFTKSP